MERIKRSKKYFLVAGNGRSRATRQRQFDGQRKMQPQKGLPEMECNHNKRGICFPPFFFNPTLRRHMSTFGTLALVMRKGGKVESGWNGRGSIENNRIKKIDDISQLVLCPEICEESGL